MNAKPTTRVDQIQILDVPFTSSSFSDILKYMDNGIKNCRDAQYISITNTESLYHALRLPFHRQYIRNATFSCCDGVGIVLAAKMFGYKIRRLHGPDLMLKCCEYGLKRKWRHFFYGGKAGVPELLQERLSEKYPGLIVAGGHSPPFRRLTPQEEQDTIDLLNSARPDILWVGLGLIKQERWIAEHIKKISISWMIGVGAAFDFHAGTIKRAPKPIRNIGLEWLYRLAFEPRMFVRNVYSLSLILSLTKYAMRHRRNSLPHQ
jgi:N-acetylglucosaminyldiphosphoundecaprenol N-acetyl-beta-D-mannosaminyltransferase